MWAEGPALPIGGFCASPPPFWRESRVLRPFLPGRQQQLRPLLEQRLADLARQAETPFFRAPALRLPAALRSGGYYLTEEGLALWFPQESLAPRNAGLPTVLVPYGALEGLLRFSF